MASAAGRLPQSRQKLHRWPLLYRSNQTGEKSVSPNINYYLQLEPVKTFPWLPTENKNTCQILSPPKDSGSQAHLFLQPHSAPRPLPSVLHSCNKPCSLLPQSFLFFFTGLTPDQCQTLIQTGLSPGSLLDWPTTQTSLPVTFFVGY